MLFGGQQSFTASLVQALQFAQSLELYPTSAAVDILLKIQMDHLRHSVRYDSTWLKVWVSCTELCERDVLRRASEKEDVNGAEIEDILLSQAHKQYQSFNDQSLHAIPCNTA